MDRHQFVVNSVAAAALPRKRPFPFPTEDRGVVYANVYGEGDRGVVLAHRGRFNKESWEKQAQTLTSARLQDFEYWRSISAATVNGEAQAAPHQ